MGPRAAVGRVAIGILCALSCARTVWRAAEQPPLYNWDLVAYVALAHAFEVDDPVEVHARTYRSLREELPEPVYRSLITGGVRQARFEDPRALWEHLAFYRARVLYTLPMAVLHHAFGVEWTRTTWWISRGAWLAFAALCAAWAARALGVAWGLPVGTLFAHAPWFVAHLGYSSPDMEATFLTCLGIFLLVELRRDWAAALVLVAAIGVRPDTIILNGILALALFALGPRSRSSLRWTAAWALVSGAVYLGVQRYAGAYGWWPLVWISFFHKEAYPTTIPTQPDWALYWKLLKAKVAALPYPPYDVLGSGVKGSILPFATAGAALAGIALSRTPSLGRQRALFVALVAAFTLRWLLFPQLWDRFFAVPYACVPLVLLSMAAARVEGAAPPVRPLEPASPS